MSPASPDSAGDALEKKWGGLEASSVLARLDEQSDIGRLVAEDRLRVRLVPENAPDTRPNLHELVTRPLAPGLLQAVVVNYPDSAMMLNRSSLGDISENEVFGAALRTSLDTEPSDLHATEVWHVPITQIGGAQWYVGAHVHVLRRYLGTARYGALVSFPIPECMLIHEIGARIFVISAMTSMQALTEYHIADRDKPLSPQIFWWRPGAYEQMPEDTALYSGTVPELQPVEIETDHEARTTRLCTRATEELFDLWTRELLGQWRRRPDRA